MQISTGVASWQRYYTASSIGRQLNFVALNRGRHLCSAGRPSRWALAHILVGYYFVSCLCNTRLWASPKHLPPSKLWFYGGTEMRTLLLLPHAVNCVRFCFWCCLWLLLFVYEISREPLKRSAPNSQGRRVYSFAPKSLNVKVKG